MTPQRAQLDALMAKKKRGKGRATWTRDSRGRNHPSGEEARWFDRMYAAEARGEIVIEEIEPTWTITLADAGTGLLKAELCKVKGDLRIYDVAQQRRRFLDWKGRSGDLPLSRLKHRAVRIQHHVEIELVGHWVERKAKAKAKKAATRELLKRTKAAGLGAK